MRLPSASEVMHGKRGNTCNGALQLTDAMHRQHQMKT
ncbi:hypothetical protein FHR55_001878 [Xanthomonas arboricola]